MQVRVSPKISKIKDVTTKKRTKKTGTGVPAAQNYPSTNVSSPIQAAASRRRQKNVQAIPEIDEDNCFQMHPNGYENDSFVVPDGDVTEDDDFRPIREGKQRRLEPSRRKPLGNPITQDHRMEEINEIHKDVIDHFLGEAKRICQDIQMKKGLRTQPFSNTVLREMAIHFPKSLDEMKFIPNINKEFVDRYGKKILDLVQSSRQQYLEMMSPGEGPIRDENHEIVNLVSDDDEAQEAPSESEDEEEEEGEDVEEDFGSEPSFDDDEEEIRSSYFVPSAEVEAFNQQAGSIQTLERSASGPSRAASSRSRAGDGTRGGNKKSYKRKSGGSGGSYARARSNAGVSKRSTVSRRTSGGAGPTSRRGKAPANSGFGISMMPT